MLNQTNEICYHGFISENGLFGLYIDAVAISFLFGFLFLSRRYFFHFAPTWIFIIMCLIVKDVVYITVGMHDWALFDLCVENKMCILFTSLFLIIFMFILIVVTTFFIQSVDVLEKILNKNL